MSLFLKSSLVTALLVLFSLKIAQSQCPATEYGIASSWPINVTNANNILNAADNNFAVFNDNNAQLVVRLQRPVLAGTRITLRLRRNNSNSRLQVYNSDVEASGYNNGVQYDANNTPLGTTVNVTYTASRNVEYLLFLGVSNNNNSFSVDAISYCSLNFAISNSTVAEEVGNATFNVTYTGANTSAFTFNYATANGTAQNGTDYMSSSGSLAFTGTSGQILQITVPILNDLLAENSEVFYINFSNTSNGYTTNPTFATITITDTDSPIPNNTPLVLVDEFSGHYDYSTTGGSLRTQDNSSPCTIKTSSSNTLLSPISAGASISKAYLYWAHSSTQLDNVVTFEGQIVTADKIYGSNLNNNGTVLQFYNYVADVTSLVQGIANPSTNVFDFSGLTIDNTGSYCTTATVMGGWTLMVFYEQISLPAVTINLYEGFKGESNSSSAFALSGFYAIGALGSKTTILSWEGDQTLSNNERLLVTSGTGTYTLSGDGDNNGSTINNPFNSTIFDNTVTPNTNQTTSYGLDLDTYDISSFIQSGETSVTTTVQAGQDYVMMNAVLLKVPANLITGDVFEDRNYGGGGGRSLVTASGTPIGGARVELFNEMGTLIGSTNTKATGDYSFGGMANGNYRVRVVNSSVRSSRGGGSTCTACIPVQTFKRSYASAGGFTDHPNEVGGANPFGIDPGNGTLTNAQTVSTVTITSEGVVGLDFGFNFNTIVNTNVTGQGSLKQFMVNANNLDETGLDISANSIFDPSAGEDTSIFMIPPTADPLGRVADVNFTNGYFNIFIPNTDTLPILMAANTKIDGRTQTAYSSDTNTGTAAIPGTTVGTSAIALPNYYLPEIQVHRNDGDVFRNQGNNSTIRNLAIYANNNSGIRVDDGQITISYNSIGVNAAGANAGFIKSGIEITGGMADIDGNYIATNQDAGILVNGGTSITVQNNYIANNGSDGCEDNITIQSGTGIAIERNYITNAASLGIDANGTAGNLFISQNTILNSGQNGTNCSGFLQNVGIRLDGNNSTIINNIIANNGGPGLVLTGGSTTGNLISQNSFYANGTATASLGIDLDVSDNFGDGVTLNDLGDVDNGPNGAINFPIISTIYKSGTNMIVEGWSRPGATLEFFLADISTGNAILGDNQLGLSKDYGEGQIYLGSVVEGSPSDTNTQISLYTDSDNNTDNTNLFRFVLPLSSGVKLGDHLTATATLANTTSEFSPISQIKAYTLITNRKITYRVNSN